MITASTRLNAFLAGGAALAAFGLTAPVMADGANDGCPQGVYCGPGTQPDREGGTASENGNGSGNAKGRPAAGSVGNADHKNPPGQLAHPNTDGNNGYECDGNNGIAKSNPAHTSCADDPYDPGDGVDN